MSRIMNQAAIKQAEKVARYASMKALVGALRSGNDEQAFSELTQGRITLTTEILNIIRSERSDFLKGLYPRLSHDGALAKQLRSLLLENLRNSNMEFVKYLQDEVRVRSHDQLTTPGFDENDFIALSSHLKHLIRKKFFEEALRVLMGAKIIYAPGLITNIKDMFRSDKFLSFVRAKRTSNVQLMIYLVEALCQSIAMGASEAAKVLVEDVKLMPSPVTKDNANAIGLAARENETALMLELMRRGFYTGEPTRIICTSMHTKRKIFMPLSFLRRKGIFDSIPSDKFGCLITRLSLNPNQVRDDNLAMLVQFGPKGVVTENHLAWVKHHSMHKTYSAMMKKLKDGHR